MQTTCVNNKELAAEHQHVNLENEKQVILKMKTLRCYWFFFLFFSFFFVSRGRQRADDSQSWDLPSYGQHPEWHGGLGEDYSKGHMGTVWWRSVWKISVLVFFFLSTAQKRPLAKNVGCEVYQKYCFCSSFSPAFLWELQKPMVIWCNHRACLHNLSFYFLFFYFLGIYLWIAEYPLQRCSFVCCFWLYWLTLWEWGESAALVIQTAPSDTVNGCSWAGPSFFQLWEFDVYYSWLLFKRTSHLSKMPPERWPRLSLSPSLSSPLSLSQTHTEKPSHTGLSHFCSCSRDCPSLNDWSVPVRVLREWRGQENLPEGARYPGVLVMKQSRKKILWTCFSEKFEKCAAVASPSGFWEIYVMVITRRICWSYSTYVVAAVF